MAFRRSTISAAEGRWRGSVCRQSRMSCDTPAGQASEGGGGCTKPRRGTSCVTISHSTIPNENESAGGRETPGGQTQAGEVSGRAGWLASCSHALVQQSQQAWQRPRPECCREPWRCWACCAALCMGTPQTQPTDLVGARRGQQQLWGSVGQRASEVAGALCNRGQANSTGQVVAVTSAVAAMLHCSAAVAPWHQRSALMQRCAREPLKQRAPAAVARIDRQRACPSTTRTRHVCVAVDGGAAHVCHLGLQRFGEQHVLALQVPAPGKRGKQSAGCEPCKQKPAESEPAGQQPTASTTSRSAAAAPGMLFGRSCIRRDETHRQTPA